MPELAQLLPLPEAAKKLGLSLADLHALVEAGTIQAGILPSGEIVVSEKELTDPKTARPGEDINAQLRAIKRTDFAYLKGQGITVTEAAEKYKIPGVTIRHWVKRGYVTIINPDAYPMHLDAADVAYCFMIYKVRKPLGILAPLLDKNGQPYLLKRPRLSEYRRQKKAKV